MTTTIDVSFTANTSGTPGTWDFSPSVSIRAHHPSTVRYQLDRSCSSEGWFFDHIAIGENSPRITDFIEIGPENLQEIEYAGLVVKVEFSPHRDWMQLSIDGIPTQRISLGVLLTVTNGRERHTCRDPQITLGRDPDFFERVPDLLERVKEML